MPQNMVYGFILFIIFYLHSDVHCSIIYNTAVVETTRIHSTDKETDAQ